MPVEAAPAAILVFPDTGTEGAEHETTAAQNVDGEGDRDILAFYPLRDSVYYLCFYGRQLLSWRRKLAACFLPLLHPLRVCLALGGSSATHTRHQDCKNR